MRYLTTLCIILLFFGTQFAYGQTKSQGEEHRHRHKLSGTEIALNLPSGFTPGKSGKDEFVFQEKGSVLKFALVENIPVSTFCDSLTDKYFAKQGLRDMLVLTQQDIKIYKGKFDINTVPYIRAFYIYPYKNSTVVSIANYPENLEKEFEESFLLMFNLNEHE